MHPHRYTTERHKVVLTNSLLTGPAAHWATPLFMKSDPQIATFNAFCEALNKTFGDPTLHLTAGIKIRQLFQGRKDVSEFIAEFRTLAPDTRWDQEALKSTFIRNLSRPINELMLSMPEPSTLEEAIDSAIRADSRLQRFRSQYNCGDTYHGNNQQSTNVVPMDLGTARQLSREETRDHRMRNNLCLYCGDVNHKIRECKKRQQGKGLAHTH